MNISRTTRMGFTLLEAMISMVLVVLGIGMALTGYLYAVKSQAMSDVQFELDVDTQNAMERLKRDLRISTLDKMFFYPPGGSVFEAVSFPQAEDSNGDGIMETNGDGTIYWDKQLIYHVMHASPDKLLVTTFSPRNAAANDAQRQAQLNQVVADGHGGNAKLTGESCNTYTCFVNLVNFQIRPRGSTFDGYSSTTNRDTVNMGSCIMLSPGSHDFKFTLTGKSQYSSGYKAGVDSMFVSPCYMPREGENQAAISNSGATAVRQEIMSGSWDGNQHLYFPAAATNASFILRMDNDRWEESNFNGDGILMDGTKVIYDLSETPHDYLVVLEGNETNWDASVQTGDTTGTVSVASNLVSGCAVRVLVRGSTMVNGGWITCNGGKSRYCFRSGDAQLAIESASVAECSMMDTPSMDASNTPIRIKFSNADAVTIPANTMYWSDWTSMPISRDKSYLVSYKVKNASGQGSAKRWASTTTTESTYVRPNADIGDVDVVNWSTTFTNVTSTPDVIGVRSVHASYVTNGVFTSQAVDTRIGAPTYSSWSWWIATNAGTQTMKIRTGSDKDMSDASAWGLYPSPSSVSLPAKRFVQFQLFLQPSADMLVTPKVKGVTIIWQGVTNIVNVGGTFTKGPDYGVFELTVDGNKLKSGMQVELELYKDVKGFRRQGEQRVTSYLVTEVMPRNTGK